MASGNDTRRTMYWWNYIFSTYNKIKLTLEKYFFLLAWKFLAYEITIGLTIFKKVFNQKLYFKSGIEYLK
jgi:hypothetical protein